MKPVIALVGRPNVGKSTLFNRLVGRKLALVDDQPGVTRDRREGEGRIADLAFTVIDTAGLEEGELGTQVGHLPRLALSASHKCIRFRSIYTPLSVSCLSRALPPSRRPTVRRECSRAGTTARIETDRPSEPARLTDGEENWQRNRGGRTSRDRSAPLAAAAARPPRARALSSSSGTSVMRRDICRRGESVSPSRSHTRMRPRCSSLLHLFSCSL